MARKKSRRKAKAKVPFYVAPIAGAIIGTYMDDAVQTGIARRDLTVFVKGVARAWTGWNSWSGLWRPEQATGAIGLGGGMAVSKVASMASVNNRIPNLGKYSIRV